MPKSILPKQ